MEIKFTVRYQEHVIKIHIPNLPVRAKKTIKKAIDERLTVDPVSFGKPLQYSFKGHRRLRVGDYRVIYRIDIDLHIVVIVAIKHRKDVYQQ